MSRRTSRARRFNRLIKHMTPAHRDELTSLFYEPEGKRWDWYAADGQRVIRQLCRWNLVRRKSTHTFNGVLIKVVLITDEGRMFVEHHGLDVMLALARMTD